ncbi:MAG TPA: AMP-binding protein [Thermoanaerobaculia bacterium]|nr:AMP-binding protein [Thermoanaerobaculia bacterium]
MTASAPEKTLAAPPPLAIDEAVLRIAAELAREVHPQGKAPRGVGRETSLERDLGLDSLGRAELVRRLERAGGVTLPEQALGADTLGDLLQVLAAAGVAGSDPTYATQPGTDPASYPLQPPAEAAPDSTRTLIEVLAWHAERHAGRRHISFYPGEGPAEELTYGALAGRARGAAARLIALGVEPGQAVALMLPSGLDYFAAFFAALYAGAVPVPLYPPARRSQIADHLQRQAGILRTAEAVALITFPEVLAVARLLRAQVPGLRRVLTMADLEAPLGRAAAAGDRPLPPVAGGDIAFLQFTSGSTGKPKGVILTHANLLANLRAIGQAVEIGPGDAVVSWLPLYHDMGLIGAWMASLYYGMPLALMSPLTFLARPARWLQAVSRHRGTLSAAPNFAYELCTRKIEDAELAGVDLSSWRFALNGAEPVSPDAIGRFAARFAPYGFRAEAMAPVYGLAECSLALAFPPLGRGPAIDTVRREPLERAGRAIAAPPGEPGVLRFAGCGFPLPGHEVRIVDSAGREAGEREEGRLEFRGPSAASGYFRDAEATRRLRHGDWLDSGDRAYIAGGEIFVTGRVKDIIIRAGRNIYPHELEAAVSEVPGVRKGCVVAFGSPDPATGTERLVVVAESREREAAARERLGEAIQRVTVDLLGEPADDVVVAAPHGVPKTSSGKVRRAACSELYLAGRLGAPGGRGALWWQLVRLAAVAARTQVTRSVRAAGGLLYSGYCWLVFGLVTLPMWAAAALLPGLERRRRLARGTARLLFRLAGIPLRAAGLENLLQAGGPEPRPGPCIVAANHASYLDGLVLTAVLPARFAYVVKRELENHLLSRVLLRRLGALFVERFDLGRAAGETDKTLAALGKGESLAVFPEGTFRRRPGLRPFRMGAFVTAAQAGIPIVPVVIRGTRHVLRGDRPFFRRGAVEVTVCPPLRPQAAGWDAAVVLRAAVRAEILGRCGEPDLGSETAEPG